jgi:hypothetical protein
MFFTEDFLHYVWKFRLFERERFMVTSRLFAAKEASGLWMILLCAPGLQGYWLNDWKNDQLQLRQRSIKTAEIGRKLFTSF